MPLPPESLEKIRQQFDHAPYPNVRLEESPRQQFNLLFTHSLVTPHYLKHRRVIQPQGRLILDAGCGSGYKSLILAEANPGATIIGIDLSEASVNLSRQRLRYHGFEQVEFHTMLIADLPSLGLAFDYINCDEVLYLLPDPLAGLQALKSVLKPDGILRTNLHSAYQRQAFYQAQALFHMMGLMDQSPEDLEIDLVVETMRSLQNHVTLKANAWHSIYEQQKKGILVDHLLLGDKGFTIPDLFTLLGQADLELVNLVNWRQWELPDLFQDPNHLPEIWQQKLPTLSLSDRLHLYELLNPVHRLIDFWCVQPGCPTPSHPLQSPNWPQATVTLHPQLQHDSIRQALLTCCQNATPFSFSPYIPISAGTPIPLSSNQAAALLPLWEAPQPITAIAHRYLSLNPVQFPSLAPMTLAIATDHVKHLITQLEQSLYVLVE